MTVVADRAAMKALPTSVAWTFLAEEGRRGSFRLRAGTIPFSDPAEGVFVASNTAGFFWEREGVYDLNPAMFGASLDPLADCGAAINALIAFVRQTFTFPHWDFLYQCNFLGRMWRSSISINATNIQQNGLVLKNGGIFSTAAGKIALDLAGTNSPTLESFHVEGDATSAPVVGVLLSRSKIGGVVVGVPNATLSNVTISGYFSKSAMLSFGAEVQQWQGVDLTNKHRSLFSYTFVCAGHWSVVDAYLGGLTSDYCTLPVAADGSQSNVLLDMGAARIHHSADVVIPIVSISKAANGVVIASPSALAASGLQNGDKLYFHDIAGMTQLNGQIGTVGSINVGAGTFTIGINTSGYGTFTSGNIWNQTGPAIILNGTGQAKMRAGYVLAYGNDPVILAEQFGVNDRGIDLEFQAEPHPAQVVRIDGPTTATTAFIDGLRLRLLNQFQTIRNQVIGYNGAAGNIWIANLELTVDYMTVAPANKVIGTPAKFQLYNFDIRVPMGAAINDFSIGGGWFGGSKPIGTSRVPGSPPSHWGLFQTYTPIMTKNGGSGFFSEACSGEYQIDGNVCHLKVSCNITTSGPGGTNVVITLPVVAKAGTAQFLSGGAVGVSGKGLKGQINGGATQMTVTNSGEGTYPGADGEALVLSGTYFINA